MSLIKRDTPEHLNPHPSPFISIFLKTSLPSYYSLFLQKKSPLSGQIFDETRYT